MADFDDVHLQDTPAETTKDKILKHIPGTDANKVHKDNKDQSSTY